MRLLLFVFPSVDQFVCVRLWKNNTKYIKKQLEISIETEYSNYAPFLWLAGKKLPLIGFICWAPHYSWIRRYFLKHHFKSCCQTPKFSDQPSNSLVFQPKLLLIRVSVLHTHSNRVSVPAVNFRGETAWALKEDQLVLLLDRWDSAAASSERRRIFLWTFCSSFLCSTGIRRATCPKEPQKTICQCLCSLFRSDAYLQRSTTAPESSRPNANWFICPILKNYKLSPYR